MHTMDIRAADTLVMVRSSDGYNPRRLIHTYSLFYFDQNFVRSNVRYRELLDTRLIQLDNLVNRLLDHHRFIACLEFAF